jgi:hypothetical protein
VLFRFWILDFGFWIVRTRIAGVISILDTIANSTSFGFWIVRTRGAGVISILDLWQVYFTDIELRRGSFQCQIMTLIQNPKSKIQNQLIQNPSKITKKAIIIQIVLITAIGTIGKLIR